LFLFEIEIVLT